MNANLQVSALDVRLTLMAVVLAAMAIVFHLVTGTFLTPENLYNIVAADGGRGHRRDRDHADHRGAPDRSVGRLGAGLRRCADRLSDVLQGLALGARPRWPGSALALLIGLYQGWLTAVLGVPSFVVTLGGLMSFRGAAFLVADGKTQPVSDPVFLALGGGLDGSLGPALSWALGAVLVALIGWSSFARRGRASASTAFRCARWRSTWRWRSASRRWCWPSSRR